MLIIFWEPAFVLLLNFVVSLTCTANSLFSNYFISPFTSEKKLLNQWL